MIARTLRLHPKDNIVIALENLPKGSVIEGGVQLIDPVRRGHKIATETLQSSQHVFRYGQVIGETTTGIAAGQHVHSHNLSMTRFDQDFAIGQSTSPLAPIADDRTFEGFHRADGRVGTRNYIGVISTVNCSGSVAQFIAEAVLREPWFQEMENIDGVVPIAHNSGCGIGIADEGYETLMRTIAGYIKHPNFGGVLLVGLGCEVLQVSAIVERGRMRADNNLHFMTIQQTGGTRKTVEEAVSRVRAIAEQANKAIRKPASVSHLTVGLQCGGSDGYSGITANPALGVASDLLVRRAGTTILSETSEIYGAQHLLTRRVTDPQIAHKLLDRISWWEDYTARRGNEMNNNPSPGNKLGGLTTILEKSLGAVAKAGSAPLSAYYNFAETIDRNGFVYMDSPGYDPCSVTGQVAAGATLIAFTTGRGSVSGYKPTPSIKIATNSEMYVRMSEDMDINCGDIIDTGVTLEEKGKEIFELFLQIASGEKTKSEALGYGGVEFVPWQIGAML